METRKNICIQNESYFSTFKYQNFSSISDFTIKQKEIGENLNSSFLFFVIKFGFIINANDKKLENLFQRHFR